MNEKTSEIFEIVSNAFNKGISNVRLEFDYFNNKIKFNYYNGLTFRPILYLETYFQGDMYGFTSNSQMVVPYDLFVEKIKSKIEELILCNT
ncbi:hypothetical protein [Sphingobacterium spiritivorum]|uniref:hypothetical protein n=1 Tax=Sphingobacterium spiritivorum TaxID=258 RepID=UPI003DA220B1